jgi:hypothetical protein
VVGGEVSPYLTMDTTRRCIPRECFHSSRNTVRDNRNYREVVLADNQGKTLSGQPATRCSCSRGSPSNHMDTTRHNRKP